MGLEITTPGSGGIGLTDRQITLGSDGTVTNQVGDYSLTVAPGATEKLPYGKVKDKDGNDVQVDYKPSTDGYIFESDGCTGGGGTITINVYSEAEHTTQIINKQFGETVYLKAVASIAVANYQFFARLNEDVYFIDENATGEVTWAIDVPVGNIEIIVIADETISNVVAFEVTGLLLDAFPTCNGAFSVFKLLAGYAGNCMTVRRTDNATLGIGFVSELLDVDSIVSFVGVGNSFDAIWYDQTGTGDATQVVGNDQPYIALSGVVTEVDGVPTVTFTSSREYMSMIARTVVSGFIVERKASNTNLVQYILGGSSQGLASGGSLGGSNAILLYTPGGTIVSTIDDTLNHQISFNCGAAGSAAIYVDGTLAASGSTSPNMTISTIGALTSGLTLAHVGSISEIITFPDNQIANRAVFHASQQARFGTP